MPETYSYSGDRRILERAFQAITEPGVAAEIQAWREGHLTPGHMVITYENIRLQGSSIPGPGTCTNLLL